MPLSVLAAMMRSRNPEEFLDLLIGAIKNDQWAHSLPEDAELKKIKDSAEESSRGRMKPYDGISFVSKQNSRKVMYFNLGRTDPDGKDGSSAAITLFDDLRLPVEGEWENAKRVLGSVRVERDQSLFDSLYIPADVVLHWKPFTALKRGLDRRGMERRGAAKAFSKLNVYVDEKKLDELNNYRAMTQVSHDFNHTLDLLQHKITLNQYLGRVSFTPKVAPQDEENALRAMVASNSQYLGFMRRLAGLVNSDATTGEKAEKIERSIASNFGIEKSRFTRKHAEFLANRLDSQAREATGAIASEIEVRQRYML